MMIRPPDSGSAAPDWAAIDTVLLDMDGTLLDLGFDNWFWREHLPAAYARANALSAAQAAAALEPRFRAAEGTLEWYCIRHWSRELALDIGTLKRDTAGRVRYLPGAMEFLRWLSASGKRRVLVTNAHPDTLAIKDGQVSLTEHLDEVHSSHDYGRPKESVEFWPRLAERLEFDPARTLFVDDSLPVLRAAHAYGIGHVRAVRRPEYGGPRRDTAPFLAVDSVAELAGPEPPPR